MSTTTTPPAFNMVNAVNQFTDGNGQLTPVAYRFLFNLFNQMKDLQAQIDTINTRLTAAGIA